MPAVSKQGNVMAWFGGSPNGSPSATTTTRVDASTEIVAASFINASTSAITDVDLQLKFTGDTTTVTFRVSIQGDSGGSPDGTPIGGTATFAGQNNTGQQWTGLQTLSAGGTGALTVGDKLWVVVDVSVAGAIDATHYIEMLRDNQTPYFPGSRVALYTGSWTVQTSYTGMVVCKRADLSYTGFPFILGNQLHGSASSIYNSAGVDNRQGLRIQAGSKLAICGASVLTLTAGTPGALVLTLYEGSTSRASVSCAFNDITSGQWGDMWFGTPYLCAADSVLYLVFSQAAGDNSNDYNIRGTTFHTTYIECAVPGTSWRFVYGTGTDPTAYTVDSTGFAPRIIPFIADPTVDLDQAAAGGGAPNLFAGTMGR